MEKTRNSFCLIFYYSLCVLVISLVVAAFISFDMPIIKGFLIGYVFTVLKILLMERILLNSLKKDANKAASYVKIHYFFRFFLSFLILVISFADKSINGYVVAILFLALKPAAYIYGLRMKTSESSFEIVEYDDDDYDEFGDF